MVLHTVSQCPEWSRHEFAALGGQQQTERIYGISWNGWRKYLGMSGLMKAKITRLCGITIKGFIGMESKKELNGTSWNGLNFRF